ncbi:MAG: FtsH protease activity modulator HflK [Gammaproteobacteria bacterium]|nr:FtsH protease activity modulator HflK [Gammaproteobacteria bacterium]
MAWNEPGGNKDNDPWGGGGNGKNQGPPDLDEIVRKLQDKLSSVFGGGSGSGGSNVSGIGGASGNKGPIGLIIIAAILWLIFDSLHIIDQAERGVVTRFGAYVATLSPGLNVRMPRPIEYVERVNVEQVRTAEIGYQGGNTRTTVLKEALMLTKDEAIVEVKFAVQYKVIDAKNYLFNIIDPDETLVQATESAIREIVGKNEADYVLTEGRSELAQNVRKLVQEIIDRYDTGLLVLEANMQDAQPPEQVQAAFDDAIKSREDQERFINEAQAYSNDILPKARGQAARQIEEANGYKERVIARAEGESDRFTKVLIEYERAPEITRERLYIESMESVLANTSKILIDSKSSNNLLYLPLDRLIDQSSNTARGASSSSGQINSPSSSGTLRDSSRLRGAR